jgi:capsular polysaccharide biosynthesis protein
VIEDDGLLWLCYPKKTSKTYKGSDCSRESVATLLADILGLPLEKRLVIRGNVHFKAKWLVVPSLIGYTSNYPKWAVEFLRREFAVHSQAGHGGGYERIYVSRTEASYRKVTNEEQVMNLLEKYQVKKVIASELPVAEQIRVFASAKMIVSPHGANMTNVLFCQPGTKIIELFSPGYVNPINWVISNHAGLDY